MGAASVPRNARNLVVRSMRATFKLLGGAPAGLEVVCANRVPHGRGLGSSAAAIVAGVVAARGLVVGGAERLDDAAALAHAAELEGHPDNVAACLLGGLTIAWHEAGRARAVQVPVSDALAPVAFVPGSSASTKSARKVLPDVVPHVDAASNAARAALLVEALRSHPDDLLAATEDRLHQPYRADVMPRTAALVAELRDAGLPAVVSGAGPSVLVLTTTTNRDKAMGFARRGWSALPLDIDRTGAHTAAL
jgi:homoserine kinase